MTFDLATAKKRLGIPDAETDNDEAIQSALDISLALAEKYCDRRFEKKSETARFTRQSWPTLLVRRYPIASIAAIRTPDGTTLAPTSYVADLDFGMITVGWGGGWRWPGGVVEVDFEGGFDPLPADLEAALWLVFDSVWSTTPGMGLPPGSTAEAGAVRSFSIDGMSIGFDTSAASGSTGDGKASAWGPIPAYAIATLDFYRAETAWGGA